MAILRRWVDSRSNWACNEQVHRDYRGAIDSNHFYPTAVPDLVSLSAVVARSLGADETINFREETVAAYVDRITAGHGFDVVFDTIGGDNLKNSFAATAYEGRAVTTYARTTQDLTVLAAKALSLHVVFMLLPMLRDTGRERHALILRNIARLVEEKRVRPLLDKSCFTLETAPDAYRRIANGKARGQGRHRHHPQSAVDPGVIWSQTVPVAAIEALILIWPVRFFLSR